MSKKVGISMSGGGVKSMIYLGVLQALSEHGIHPDVVGGLSGGSVIAGLTGIGMTTTQIFDVMSQVHVSKLLDLNPFDGVEILDQNKVYDLFKQLCDGKQIEDCNPKVVIFATDYDAQDQVVITKGELARAMTASCALFPIMQPLKMKDLLLMEGGFTTHYGANYLREAGAEVVIGIDVDGFANMHKGKLIEIIFHAIDSAVGKMSEYEQKLYPVDLEVTDFQDSTGMLDFNKAGKNLVDVGYAKAMEVMPYLEKLLA